MTSGIGSRSYPIVLFDDDIEQPAKINSGTKVSPIVLSSDDEDDAEEVEDSLRVATQHSSQDVKEVTGKRYIGGSPDKYSFNGTGVAYDIMLSMGYLPGKGLGSQMKGDITPIPVSLGKRKQGLGFEATSPPSSPEPQPTPASHTSSDPLQAAHPMKKVKPALPQGEPESTRNLSSISRKNSQSTPTLPQFLEPSSSTNPVPTPMDIGFDEYVSTLSGFAMATMPTAMHAAVAADPMTAFQLAQSYFNPNFNLSPPLLPNMPHFHLGQPSSAIAVGGTSMIPSNGSQVLPSAQLSALPDANLGSKTKELKRSKKDRDVGVQPPSIRNPKACIGWIPQPKFPNRGVFQIDLDSEAQTHWGDMHVPSVECCLVMEDLPNKHRNTAFVKEWSDQFNPNASFGVVDTSNGKALIEFASTAVAMVAYQSPRLQGPKYGKAQHVRVFWHRCPGDRTKLVVTSGSSSAIAAPTQSVKKKRKRQEEREKNARELSKVPDVPLETTTFVPQVNKEKGPASPIPVHPPPTPSQSVFFPKIPGSASPPMSNTTLAPAPPPASVSPILCPPLERNPASLSPSAQTASPSPDAPFGPCAVKRASRGLTYSKRLESQSRIGSPMVIEGVNGLKAGVTPSHTSLLVIPSAAALPLHLPVQSSSPSVSPGTPPGVPNVSSAVSPSEPFLRTEGLLEQRLRLQLLAKKQLASAALSSGASMDVDTDVLRTANCKVMSLPRQTSEPLRQLNNSSSWSSQDAVADNNIPDGNGEVSRLTITTSFENLATSFITETLHSAKEQATNPAAREVELGARADRSKSTSAPVGSANDLAARQQRLARQIADSKLLMERYQAARTKAEKDGIMQLLKEQNRLMGGSKPPSEEQTPAGVTRVATAAKFSWPQFVDSGVFLVSDDEDDTEES